MIALSLTFVFALAAAYNICKYRLSFGLLISYGFYLSCDENKL